MIPCVAVDDPANMAADILLIGCGHMGGALLKGWLANGMARRATVIDPAVRDVETVFGQTADGAVGNPTIEVIAYCTATDLPATADPDVVVLAVKPQVMDEVLPTYRRFARPGTVFLSVAAGKTLAFFAQRLGDGVSVVRAMPNTPAAIGQAAERGALEPDHGPALAGFRVRWQHAATAALDFHDGSDGCR